MVFPRDVDVASFFFVPSARPQGSLTKIEDLIKAYGTPVVSKVQEKYPTYMTTVDAKVRSRPIARVGTNHLAFFRPLGRSPGARYFQCSRFATKSLLFRFFFLGARRAAAC